MTTAMCDNQKEWRHWRWSKSEGIEEVHPLSDSSPKSENAFKSGQVTLPFTIQIVSN